MLCGALRTGLGRCDVMRVCVCVSRRPTTRDNELRVSLSLSGSIHRLEVITPELHPQMSIVHTDVTQPHTSIRAQHGIVTLAGKSTGLDRNRHTGTGQSHPSVEPTPMCLPGHTREGCVCVCVCDIQTFTQREGSQQPCGHLC